MKTLLIVILLGAAACAPYASNISPSPISAARYDGWSCDKLRVEQHFVEESLARVSADQDSAASMDILTVFLIGVPTSGGGVKGEVARLKGEQIAIRRAMLDAGCLTTKASTTETTLQVKIAREQWIQCRIGGPLHKGNTRACLKEQFAIDIPESDWESCRQPDGRVYPKCLAQLGY